MKLRFVNTMGMVCLLSIGLMLQGCSNTKEFAEMPITTEMSQPVAMTESGKTPTTDEQNHSGNKEASSSALPDGVTVKRIIKEITMHNGYHKKIELLTDGGKRVTIRNANNEIVLQNIEYEGIIQSANGRVVTVKVENGPEQTITIPNDMVIEDDDGVGLSRGVEIEWVVNEKGQIERVELDK